MSEWDRRRYVAKPGEPALPPQLAEMADKSADDVMKVLNRLPFFMTELDETDGQGGENTELEALKSLAYEGEPEEIATNFKNQGNECYKVKRYNDAIAYYTKGLDVDCKIPSINSALYLNRAACNLELKNYRRCIEDCKHVLILDEKSVKACYRAAKAYFYVERYEEAKQIALYGLEIESNNISLKDLVCKIESKVKAIELSKAKKEKELKEVQFRKETLERAIKLRNIVLIESKKPVELLEEAHMHLEDSSDIESQLIFPAIIFYPTIDEFDFIAQVSELSTPQSILEVVMNRPQEWFDDPKHKAFESKRVEFLWKRCQVASSR